ncbi:MAG: hypothetical protein MUP47_07695 [Phycisphaerae bacterium]|nr:hypothetical protein [Phycisphaerae bacterium]
MAKRMAWCLGVVAVIVAALAGAATAPSQEAATQPASQPAASQPSGPGRRESEAEVLAVLKERLPLRYQRLMELKESSPEEYARNLGRMRRWYGYWKRMPPAIQDADIIQQTTSVRIWQLVDQMRQAPTDADRAPLREQLTEAVGKQFEAETVVMAYRLEMLEKALTRMRQHLAERREKRHTFLAERVERLLQATTQPADQRRPHRRGEEGFDRPGPFPDEPPPP